VALLTLGILINTDKNAEAVLAITKAALCKGHKVIMFFMDEGCRLIKDSDIAVLSSSDSVRMSLCDFNRKSLGIEDAAIAEGIIRGSQYDNALMNKEADKVIVL
jgi:predicted peroxiredoxin